MPRSVLVAGESLVDVVVGADGQILEVTPGGAPLNVAVGLARLGVPTQLLTTYGDDRHGRLVSRHLEESGVRAHPGSLTAQPTSVARALLDARRQATYEFELTWDPPAAELPPGCLAVHVGSLGTLVEPGASAVGALAARARAAGLVVSYDPNVRPAMLADVSDPWTDVHRHAAGAALVKLSDEDAEHLQPGRPLDEVMDELLAGEETRLVVATRGALGLRLVTARHRVDVPAPAVEVVDTVGAGDACMSGLLAALYDRGQLDVAGLTALGTADLEAVGAMAADVAALTCSRRGANPPWRPELASAAGRTPGS